MKHQKIRLHFSFLFVLPQQHPKMDATYQNRTQQYKNSKVLDCNWKNCKNPYNLSPSSLLSHIKTFHITPLPPNSIFRCEYGSCTFKSPTKYRLSTHIKLHVDFKAFVCKICKQSYKHRQGLIRHMKQHKNDELSDQEDSICTSDEDDGPYINNTTYEFPKNEIRLNILMTLLKDQIK